MAKPYSLDLRERIVRAVEAGSSRRGAAEQFSVSESCAIKLVQCWRRTGSVEPGRSRLRWLTTRLAFAPCWRPSRMRRWRS